MRDDRFDLGQWFLTWLFCFPVAMLLATPYLAYTASRDAGVTRFISGCIGAATVLFAALAGLYSLWLAAGVMLTGSLVSLIAIWLLNRGADVQSEDEIEESDSSVFYHDVS